jgi:ketosteroid isomerase-like protein
VSALAEEKTHLEQEAQEFFSNYIELSHSYDTALADLYSDDAVISTYRRYPHGLERVMRASGVRWKQILRQAMPIARAQNDRSEYEDLTFEQKNNTVKITAQRYSVRKCYWDPVYYMIVKKQAEGDLKIIRESGESQPQSDC